jgi:ribosomal protein L29
MLRDSKQMEAAEEIENSKEELFYSRSKAYKLEREN